MYEYIEGKLAQVGATHIVVETSGMGYFINVSLHTSSQMQGRETGKLYLHLVVKEDALTLFGFAEIAERELFRQLISVSGVGPNTARMMLSSSKPSEIIAAISSGDITALKKIKGIGIKTAERIIVDLRDKMGAVATASAASNLSPFVKAQVNREEAATALVMLGFVRRDVDKVLETIVKTSKEALSVEELVKTALKQL